MEMGEKGNHLMPESCYAHSLKGKPLSEWHRDGEQLGGDNVNKAYTHLPPAQRPVQRMVDQFNEDERAFKTLRDWLRVLLSGGARLRSLTCVSARRKRAS